MTEEEKMLSGMVYDATEAHIVAKLNATKEVIWKYNRMAPSQTAEREKILRELLGKCGEQLLILQPFYCDYGSNIEVGDGFFANFNFTVLDEAKVRIGKNAFIGPNVNIFTACHSTDVEERNTRQEWPLR